MIMTNRELNKPVIEFIKSKGYRYCRTYTSQLQNKYRLKFFGVKRPIDGKSLDRGYIYPKSAEIGELVSAISIAFPELEVIPTTTGWNSYWTNSINIYRKS